MLILLSPSKTINFKPLHNDVVPTQPEFLEQSEQLATAVLSLGPRLADVFGVSSTIATENQKQFKAWSPKPKVPQACPAAWAYRGETFAGLSIEKLDKESQQFAQKHLYIISGLYGLLRPFDLIMPYRLEMVTRLQGSWGITLYDFWGDKLSHHIEQQNPDFILNCASDAYFSVVGKHLAKDIRVITPKFLHNGIQKMAFAKYSRGLMARWAVTEKIKKSQDIVKFNAEGYVYDPKRSSENSPVFIVPPSFSLAGRWKKT